MKTSKLRLQGEQGIFERTEKGYREITTTADLDTVRANLTVSREGRAPIEAFYRVEAEYLQMRSALKAVLADHHIAGWPKTNGIIQAEAALNLSKGA